MAKKPKKCITVDDARKLEKNYVKTIQKELLKDNKKIECREFWWSLEDIEDYISYVKEEAKNKGYQNLGLRFYLGKYDKVKDDNMTMFIAPTQRVEKSAQDSLLVSSFAAGTGSGDGTNENIYDIDPMNDGSGRIPPTDY